MAQLLSVLNIIGKNLDKGLQTSTNGRNIYGHCEGIRYSRLLETRTQISVICFSGSIPLWFKNYLSKRCQEVTVLGVTFT